MLTTDKTATECEYWHSANQQDAHQSALMRPQRTEELDGGATVTYACKWLLYFSLPFLNARQGQSRIKVALLSTSNLSRKMLGLLSKWEAEHILLFEPKDDGLCSWCSLRVFYDIWQAILFVCLFLFLSIEYFWVNNLTESLKHHQMESSRGMKHAILYSCGWVHIVRVDICQFACRWKTQRRTAEVHFTSAVKSCCWGPATTGDKNLPTHCSEMICECPTGSIRCRISSGFSKLLSRFYRPVSINNNLWPVHTHLFASFEKN